MINITKEDISASAKQIRQKIKTNDLIKIKFTHQQILNFLIESIGEKTYLDIVNNRNKDHLSINWKSDEFLEFAEYRADWSLYYLEDLSETIKTNLNELCNVNNLISSIKFIEKAKDQQRVAYNKNTYSYNILGYIQFYDILHKTNFLGGNYSRFEDLGCPINCQFLVEDLYQRFHGLYKNNSRSEFLEMKIEDDNLDIPELNMIKRKLLKNEDLTLCDNLIIDIMFPEKETSLHSINKTTKDRSEKEKIKAEIDQKIRTEVSQIRSRFELRYWDTGLMSHIRPFYFYTELPSNEAIKNDLKAKIKKNSFYIGKNKENKKYLNERDSKLVYISGQCQQKTREDDALFCYPFNQPKSSVFSESLLFQALINKENAIYFDFTDNPLKLCVISSILHTSDHSRNLLILTYKELMKLSNEQMNSYVKSNKTLYIAVNIDLITANERQHLTTKVTSIIKNVGLLKKETSQNIFINKMSSLLYDDNIHVSSFLELFNSDCYKKFDKTNVILDGDFKTFITRKNKQKTKFLNKCTLLMTEENNLSSDGYTSELLEVTHKLKDNEFICRDDVKFEKYEYFINDLSVVYAVDENN